MKNSRRGNSNPEHDNDTWFLWKLAKCLNFLEQQGELITKSMRSLPSGTEDQGTLSELDFEIGRGPYDTKASEVPPEPTVELPKISVPTFDGDILNWAVFWEQFEMPIHNNKKLHNTQKLTYSQDAVEGGPAKKVIQCLVHLAGTYQEEVKCL